jgi:hypothetical protein
MSVLYLSPVLISPHWAMKGYLILLGLIANLNLTLPTPIAGQLMTIQLW